MHRTKVHFVNNDIYFTWTNVKYVFIIKWVYFIVKRIKVNSKSTKYKTRKKSTKGIELVYNLKRYSNILIGFLIIKISVLARVILPIKKPYETYVLH